MEIREIKFRVYSTVTGSFDSLTLEEAVMYNPQKISIKSLVEDLTFLQYTGFKDNEGLEVYESYIVEAFGGHVTGVVVMYEGSWSIKTETGYEPLFEAYDSCDLHVLGNVHENPELLTND